MDVPGLIRSLPDVVFFIVCAFPAALVGIGLYVGLRSYRLAGLIATTRVTAASAAQESMTAIEGKASAPSIGKALRAPLTGSICCWFHCKIEEYVRGAPRRSGAGRTVEDLTSAWPFLISDESGQCAVWPAGAEVVPPKDRSVWHGETAKPRDRNPPRESPAKRSWFRGNAVVAGSPMLRFRYTEERIYPGDGIYALGWSSSEPPVASDSIEEPMEAIEDDPSGEIEDADEETEADELGEEAEGWEVHRARQLDPAHLAKRVQNHYLISTLPRSGGSEDAPPGGRGSPLDRANRRIASRRGFGYAVWLESGGISSDEHLHYEVFIKRNMALARYRLQRGFCSPRRQLISGPACCKRKAKTRRRSSQELVGHWRFTKIVFENPRDEHLVLHADGTAENWFVTEAGRSEISTANWSAEGKTLTLSFEGGQEVSLPFTFFEGGLVFPNIPNQRKIWERTE